MLAFSFWAKIPGLPDPSFMQAANLPILFVLVRDRLVQMQFGRIEFLLLLCFVVRVVADYLSCCYADAQKPMDSPTRAGSSPPRYLPASSAHTGNTRNTPSMLNAKIIASDALERRSCGVMVVEVGAQLACADGLDGEDQAVIRGLAEKASLSRNIRTCPAGAARVLVNPSE